MTLPDMMEGQGPYTITCAGMTGYPEGSPRDIFLESSSPSTSDFVNNTLANSETIQDEKCNITKKYSFGVSTGSLSTLNGSEFRCATRNKYNIDVKYSPTEVLSIIPSKLKQFFLLNNVFISISS